MQTITPQAFMQVMTCGARRIKAGIDTLTDIDSRFGDGDHGVTMGRVADCLVAYAKQATGLVSFFTETGETIMALNCGASGPLWGTFVGGFALPLEGADPEAPLAVPQLKAVFDSALAELCGVTAARVGDKTMMDALIPAVEAGRAVPDDAPVEAFFTAMGLAARAGATASESLVPRLGRAKNYKEAALGTPDAGAMSMALFFEGMAEGL